MQRPPGHHGDPTEHASTGGAAALLRVSRMERWGYGNLDLYEYAKLAFYEATVHLHEHVLYDEHVQCVSPLCVSVQSCGMNFEWSLFEFTKADCHALSKAVKATPTLRVLRLHRSKVADDRGRQLVSHLLDHPSLSILGQTDIVSTCACVMYM